MYVKNVDDDRIAIASVTEDMFRRTGTNSEFTDGFVEYIKQIRGVEVAVLIRQVGKDLYKISMRAKGTVDVAAVCSTFGGGGHKNAAGCTMEGTIEEVEGKLLRRLRYKMTTTDEINVGTKRETLEINGFLIIDKKAGMSSYDVIRS